MAAKKSSNSSSNFFKKSQTFLGSNIAKTQSLAVPEDKRSARFLVFCWIALFASTAALLFLWTKLPKEVPLFYSKAWGKEQLVKPHFLFFPLLLSVVFIFFNSYLAKQSGESNFLKKVLLLGGGVAAILSVITIIRILILTTI